MSAINKDRAKKLRAKGNIAATRWSDMAVQDALSGAKFLDKKGQESNEAAAQLCEQKSGVWNR